MFKKIAISFFGLVVVFIGVLIAIPFFYSIDEFRPQVKTVIEGNIKGTAEVGKLSFALFPKIKLQIAGIKVTPPAPYNKQPLADVGSIEVSMPLSGLLVAPSAKIVITAPQIALITNGPTDGNLSKLMPPAPVVTGAVSAATPAKPEKSEAVGEMLAKLPPFLASRVKAARFGFEVQNAKVSMVDMKAPKGTKTEVTGLNFILKDIGLSTPMSILIDGTLDVASAGATVQGFFSNKGVVIYKPEGKNNAIDMKMDADLAKLDLAFKPLFHKPSGTAFNLGVEAKVVQSPEALKINANKLSFQFANIIAGGSFTAGLSAADPTQGQMNFKMKVSDFEVGAFGVLVPMIRDFKLGGKISVDIDANGAPTDPTLNMAIQLSGITGTTPELKKPVTDLNGKIVIAGTAKNPGVKISPFSMKIGRSDMSVMMATQGLDPMNVSVDVNSKNFDADELMGLEPLNLDAPVAATPAAPSGAAATTVSPTATSVAAALPLDESLTAMAPMVEDMAKNPFLDKVKAKVTGKIGVITALGAKFTDANMELNFANRKMVISKTGIGGYGGKVQFGMSVDLPAAAPVNYSMQASLANVKIQEMTKAHMPSFKDEIKGAMNGEMSVTGTGLRKEQLEKNLGGFVRGDLKDGQLKFPVAKITADIVAKIPQFADKIANVLPAAQREKFNSQMQGYGSKMTQGEVNKKFTTCKFDSTLQGRSLKINTIDVVYDSMGSAEKEMRFLASGQVSFDQNVALEGTTFMSPEFIRIPELKGPSGKIEVPLKVGGTMIEPKPDYAYTAKILGERLGKNLLKDLAKAKVEDFLKEKLKIDAAKAEQLKAEAVRLQAEAEAKVKAEADRMAAEQKKKLTEEAKKGLKKKFGF